MTKQEVLDELEKRGIRIDIGGCGCCGSPWVKVQIDGKVVFDEDSAGMNSIPKAMKEKP